VVGSQSLLDEPLDTHCNEHCLLLTNVSSHEPWMFVPRREFTSIRENRALRQIRGQWIMQGDGGGAVA
jgi:hypothetical protein